MNEYEIMVKDMETAIGKALGITYEGERLPFSLHTRNCLAKDLVNAGYRKVADDEIVVNKSGYVVIPKQDWEDRAYIHAMENHLCQKCRDMIGEKFVTKEEVEYWKSRCKEIGDVASKETAREILQIIKDEYEYIGDLEKIIAIKYGIDLED